MINEFGQTLGEIVENWQPAELPQEVDIIGEHVILRPLHNFTDPQLMEILYQALHHKDYLKNWAYLAYGPYKNFQEFDDFMANWRAKSDPFFYIIINKLTNNPEGIISYLRIDNAVGVIEIGHLHFSYLMQRSPRAKDAVNLLIEQAFKWGYRRVEWKCNKFNEASNLAALKYGFKFEGTFRQATINKGRNRDTNWYSIIDADNWHRIR